MMALVFGNATRLIGKGERRDKIIETKITHQMVSLNDAPTDKLLQKLRLDFVGKRGHAPSAGNAGSLR
jgi:hypothetical protein